MRRRILYTGITVLPVTLSSYSSSATPASGTKTVTAYYGGVAITDLTTSMITKGGNMSSVSVSSSGVITMSYASNTSTYSTKSSTMTLTYQGQTVTFTITQAKDYVTSTSELSRIQSTTYNLSGDPYPSTGRISYSRNTCRPLNNNIDIDVKFPALTKNVTTCYYDRSYYASGNVVDGSCKRTETNTTTYNNVSAQKGVHYSTSVWEVGTTYNIGSASLIVANTSNSLTVNVSSYSITPTSRSLYTGSTDCTSQDHYQYYCDISFVYNGTTYSGTNIYYRDAFYS